MCQNEGESATRELESLKVFHHENQYRHSIYPECPSSQDTKHSVPGKVPSPSPFSSSITLRGETTKSAIEPGSKTQIKKQKKKHSFRMDRAKNVLDHGRTKDVTQRTVFTAKSAIRI